jgi:hypothetical protein
MEECAGFRAIHHSSFTTAMQSPVSCEIEKSSIKITFLVFSRRRGAPGFNYDH